ncbi:MAG TPA: hypothetical protein DCE43_22020, partial [Planctomycetaceae bacterium]|nr:hypothetical protein [Planctomycetaceae bacterium]
MPGSGCGYRGDQGEDQGEAVMAGDERTHGPLASALRWWGSLVVSFPRLTVLLSGVLAVAGVLVTGFQLEFQTSRSDLIDPAAPF